MKALLPIAIALCGFSANVSADTLTLGIVPQQSPLKMFKAWKPITKYLSEKTGHKIVFKTEKSIAEFEKVLYSGGYDLAYVNPYHFIIANRKQDYRAAVRAKKMIRGILVAKGDDIKFDDIISSKTTRYLFPSPNAFAATLLTKFELLSKYGVNVNKQDTYQYVNSHDSVYSGIARNTGEIGGGIQRTYNNFNKKKDKNKINVIYTTDAYPSHPIAYKPTLTKETQRNLTEAFLSIPEELISTLKIKKIIASSVSHYCSPHFSEHNGMSASSGEWLTSKQVTLPCS